MVTTTINNKTSFNHHICIPMTELLVDLQCMSSEDRLSSLSQIKQSILGNDKEKSKFLLDKSDSFQNIIDILKYETEPDALRSAAIIIQSFSYLKKNIEFLLSHDVVNVLITSTVKHPKVLSELNFKTLIDIAALTPTSVLDLNEVDDAPQFINLMYRLIYNTDNKPSLIFNVAMLIPFLEYRKLSILYKAICKRLAFVLAPVIKQVLYLNNKNNDMSNFENCLSSRTPPFPPMSSSIDIMDNEISPLVYALSHLLDIIYSQSSDRNDKNGTKVVLPGALYYVLTSFLGISNLNIKLATLNVLTQYSRHHLSGSIQKVNNQKILPSLIEIIERTKLLMNESDFTLNSNYKLSRKMSPLYLLSQLSECDESTNDFLIGVNFIGKVCEIISANYKPDQEFLSEPALYKISDCLLILSCVCASKDGYRETVIAYNNLGSILTQSLKRHVDIYKDTDPENPNDLLILKLSNRITLFSAYLIRALSRSANLLRTYLVTLNLSQLLTNILRLPDDIIEKCPEEVKDKEILLKAVILGIISNLIVEFSAVRSELMADGISDILRDLINNTKFDILKQNSLVVIRNSIFGEDTNYKMELEETISLNRIFELCYDTNENVRAQSINILRNLTSDASSFSGEIINKFPDSPAAVEHGDTNFLEFLTKSLNSTSNKEILISINYIIVHLAASNALNRSLIMCTEPLLDKILEFLKEPEDESDSIGDADEDDFDDFWKIKLACVWLIINLTFRHTFDDDGDENEDDIDNSLYRDDEEETSGTAAAGGDTMDVDSNSAFETQFKKYLSPRKRALRLIQLGFYDAIKDLNNVCKILDFKERARTAIFQLVLYDETQTD